MSVWSSELKIDGNRVILSTGTGLITARGSPVACRVEEHIVIDRFYGILPPVRKVNRLYIILTATEYNLDAV